MARGKARTVNRALASTPSIRRLPLYLEIARQIESMGYGIVSGTYIAEELGLEAIQVRKDLSMTGIVGRPRIGYIVKDLISLLEAFLKWDQSQSAIIIGVGALGKSLLAYREFRKNNLNIHYAFDKDPKVIGKVVNGTEIFDIVLLKEKLKETPIKIAIIATPEFVTQEVADMAMELGIYYFWNFTSYRIQVPEKLKKKVLIYNESMNSGYAVLTTRS